MRLSISRYRRQPIVIAETVRINSTVHQRFITLDPANPA